MIELAPLARPYAKAIFTSALENKNIDTINEELKIMALVSMTDEVIKLIESPTHSKVDILKSLTKILGDSISQLSESLLKVLVDNKRLNLLENIYEIYQELLALHKKQSTIEVVVAANPSEETSDIIQKNLISTYGENAKIEFKLDPNIMGGLSVKVGDETLDLSVRGKVKKLINQLNF